MTKDEREALRESLDTMEFFDKNDIRALLDVADERDYLKERIERQIATIIRLTNVEDERDRSNARIIELLEEKLALRAVAEQAREALFNLREQTKNIALGDAVLLTSFPGRLGAAEADADMALAALDKVLNTKENK